MEMKDRIKGGINRWKDVPKEERIAIARENGRKGAKALWAKIRALEENAKKHAENAVNAI